MADTLNDLTQSAMPSLNMQGGGFSSRMTQGMERWGSKMSGIMDNLLNKAQKFNKLMTGGTNAGMNSGSGGVGSGNGMNLGLGGFSGLPNALTPRGMGMEAALMGGMGVAKLALAGGAYHYSMMPATADVFARNRLAFNSSLATSLSANRVGGMASALNGGRMTGITDPYLTAATLSMSGYGLNSMYGRSAFNTAANLGYLTGQSAPGVAQTLANNLMEPTMGTRLQMLGINNVSTKTGQPVGFQGMMDKLFDRLGFGKFKNVEQFNRELAAGYGGTNLNYYIPDPEMRQLATSYFQSKFKGGMSLNGNAKSAIDAMGGGALNAESAMRGYMGSETQKIEDFGQSLSQGATAAYKFAKSLNEALDPKNGFIQKLALGKGYLDSFLGTSAGSGGLAAATLALSGLKDAAIAATLGLAAMGGGNAIAGASNIARGTTTLGKAVRGVGGGLAAGAIAQGLHASGVAPQGSVVDVLGTTAAMAGAGALTGAGIGSIFPGPGTVIGAVGGTLVGGGIGLYQSLNSGDSQVSVVPGGASQGAAPGVSGQTAGVTGSAVANLASQQLGSPYVAGGRGPGGWDCAGFVYWVFKKLGKNLPQVSWEQVKQGTPVGSLAEAKPGDLLFFHMPSGHMRDPGPMKINHVGIYAGKGKMVHASSPTSGTIKTEVYTKYLKAIRRIVDTSKLGEGATKVLNEALQVTGTSEGILNGSAGLQTSYQVSTAGVSFEQSSLSQMLGTGGVGALPSYGARSSETKTDSVTSASGSSAVGGSVSMSAKGRGGKWLAQFLWNKGLRGETLKRMWAIGMRESGGNPGVDNSGMNRNGSVDYGLFQINDAAHSKDIRRKFGWSMNDLRDADKNFRVMSWMSKKGQDLSAWGVSNPDGSVTGWAASLSAAKRRQFESAMFSRMNEFDSYAHKAGLPGYSQGAWSISRDHTARVHTGEMILPASVAQAVRDAAQTSFSGGSAVSGNVTIHVHLSNSTDADALRFAKRVKSVMSGTSNLDTIVST